MEDNRIKKNLITWKNDLLDLTFRNKALNYNLKTLKNATKIQILSPNIENVFKLIHDKKVIEIANVNFENELNEDKYSSSVPLKTYTNAEILEKIGSFDSGMFYTNLNSLDQIHILKKINKKYLDFIDEYSINTLFLAIGFLKWKDITNSDECFYSPLIFIQTKLISKNTNKIFACGFNEESVLTLNLTLLRKLEFNYGIKFDYVNFEKIETNLEKFNFLKEFLKNNFQDEDWNFVDDVFLDTFSFSKINMYADLEQNEQKIIQNEFIRSISNETFETKTYDLINEMNVEQKIDINEYYHILDSDSSQEVAIQSAIQGESFILQGPPGTGKSHTITNIITELLARNKKILFVSEKKAALDVVYNNLNKIGLSDYAIPIHSINLDKKEVLKNLNETLSKGENQLIIDNNISKDLTTQYSHTVDFLNKYGKELLKIRKPLNVSLYKLIGIYFNIPETNELLFSLPDLSVFDETALSELKITINEIEDYCKYFNFKVMDSPWWGSKWTSITQTEKEDLIFKINTLSSLANDVYHNILNNHKSITFNDQKFALNINYLKEIFEKILNLKQKVDSKVFNISNFENELNLYKLAIEKFNIKIQLENEIKLLFNLNILNEDLKKFKECYLASVNKKMKIFNTKWSFVKSIIKKHILNKNKAIITKNVDLLFKYSDNQEELKQILNSVEYKLQSVNLETLMHANDEITLAYTLSKYNAIGDFVIDINKLITIINLDIRYPNDIKETLIKIEAFLNNFNTFSNNFEKHIVNFETLSIPELSYKMNKLLACEKDLNNMARINNSLNKAYAYGLKNFIETLFNSNLKKSFYDTFLKRFYKTLIDSIIQTSFAQFNDSNLETFRDTFTNAEKEIQKLARAKIESNLLKNIPNTTGLNSQNIEIKILKSEANKSRNIMPFKKLFEKIPNLLLNLKPCLMMSPLSVSAYLKDSDIIFDAVIFDEASQVKPETAIGAISRAKQVIIVGDTEQLPPTNFFNTIDQEFEDLESDDDISIKGFDSILSMANIALRTIKLKWHYRSLFEELIYPSNQEIYNDLITFPSKIKAKDFEGISKIYVEGNFLDRRNEKEAEKVIEVVKKIVDTYGIESSVGVVTFNQEQEMLIERKIDKFKQKNPQYSAFFDRNKQDPFFIKNIETVQGDEREFIIISTVYGPDLNGKISMRFGPINQDNGYKRLNVAFTRAKRGTILISSLKYEDIDLNRSDSRGVKFLKFYFGVAEFGVNKLIDKKINTHEFDSYFEEEVFSELTKIGYKVHTQVGSSGFRIDLAIEDPKNPNTFLLGIECDGRSYHSSKTARDRDRLRQEILEKRGWKIHRIWSTDWFSNKQNQINKIQNILKDLRTNKLKKETNSVNETALEDDKLFKFVRKQEVQLEFLKNDEFNQEFFEQHSLSPNSTSSDTYFTIKYLIDNYKIVHWTDIGKLVSYVFMVRVNSSYHKAKMFQISTALRKDGYRFDGDFVISKNVTNQEIQFKFGVKRPVDKIHYFEYVDLVTKIIDKVKLIDQDSLIQTIKSYLLFSSLTQKTKEFLFKVLKNMVENNYIQYNEETNIYQSNNE